MIESSIQEDPAPFIHALWGKEQPDRSDDGRTHASPGRSAIIAGKTHVGMSE